MKKVFALLLVLACFVTPPVYAASSSSSTRITWQKIKLDNAGTISIPKNWTVVNKNQKIDKDKYGPGTNYQQCLNAVVKTDDPNDTYNRSLLVFSYWPVPNDIEEDVLEAFIKVMGDELANQYGDITELVSIGDIAGGKIKAKALTYDLHIGKILGVRQKISAFNQGNKIICTIMTYLPDEESQWERMARQIFGRWKF